MKEIIKDKNTIISLQRMISKHLIAKGIRDENILNAFASVPRHLFVPEALYHRAYEDSSLPIGMGQTISRPYLTAYMVKLLNVKPYERVLEIGTGSGYLSAILASLCGELTSVELFKTLLNRAEAKLSIFSFSNIQFLHSDASRFSFPEDYFDKIIVSCAVPEIPPLLLNSLKPGAKMIVPIGESENQYLYEVIKKHPVSFNKIVKVRFVPLLQSVEVSEKILSAG